MHVIGLDVGGTKIAGGTINSSTGKLIDVIEIPIQAKASSRNIFLQICSVIDLLNSTDIKAICVGFPGVVNPKTGAVLFATNIPKIKNMPLRKLLSKKYKKKVFVQNDAKCFALGQLSANKKEKNIVGLIIGTGVGAGVIIDRKIVTSRDGSIGEVGKWISSTGKSFERELGGHDFVKQYHASGLKLFARATKGNIRAQKMFESYGEYLAELITIITVTYKPQRIILGGSVSKANNYFLPTTKRIVNRLKLAAHVKMPKIEVAKDVYAGVIGAAKLATYIKTTRK